MKEKFDVVVCYQTSPVLMANAARAIANKQKIPFLMNVCACIVVIFIKTHHPFHCFCL